MTVSTEWPSFSDGSSGTVDRWRAAWMHTQEEALPRGRVFVSCSAPYGRGGLGRHLREIVEALERGQRQTVHLCDSLQLPIDDGAGAERLTRAVAAATVPLALLTPAWRAWRANSTFDAEAARRLPHADHLLAFSGQALAQLRAARRAGYESASLVCATAHARRVVHQHAQAHRQYPLEGSWASRLVARSAREYTETDHIYVSSRYVQESLVEEGVAAETISLFPLSPDPRFSDQPAPPTSTFDIVYVGGLSVVKGVPLLIDAVRALNHSDMRLVLVGGWETRGMRRFVERARHRDSRIVVSPAIRCPDCGAQSYMCIRATPMASAMHRLRPSPAECR